MENKSKEEIEILLHALYNERIEKTANKQRVVHYATGRGGAIEQAIQIEKAPMELEIGRDLRDDEIHSLREKIESQVWEDGWYETGPDGLLTYRGQFDPEHPDGNFLYKVRGLWYIERWKEGARIDYKIISDEEAEELIAKTYQ